MESSPYTPPSAPDPIMVRRPPASHRVRVATRIFGLLVVLGAAALLNFVQKLAPIARDLGVFDLMASRFIGWLLLWNDGMLPFLVVILLVALAIILSFAERSRALPMLLLLGFAAILGLANLAGLNYLILEFVRATGGA